MGKPFRLKAWEPDETQTQIALVDVLRRFAHPHCLWFSIPNQRRASTGERVQQYRMGLRKGAADLCFLMPGIKPLLLELKTSEGAQSESQCDFEADAHIAGAEYLLVRSLDDAVNELHRRGIIPRNLLNAPKQLEANL